MTITSRRALMWLAVRIVAAAVMICCSYRIGARHARQEAEAERQRTIHANQEANGAAFDQGWRIGWYDRACYEQKVRAAWARGENGPKIARETEK